MRRRPLLVVLLLLGAVMFALLHPYHFRPDPFWQRGYDYAAAGGARSVDECYRDALHLHPDQLAAFGAGCSAYLTQRRR